MSDSKIKIKSNGRYTLDISNGDLTSEDAMDTAIHMSLGTDARAPEDSVLIPERRRGWLGDTVSPVQGRSLGGLIWLVDQKRLTQTNLNLSVNYAQLALNWFIEDGLAKSVVVTGEIIPKLGNRLKIIITYNNGDISTHYVKLWELTGNAA